MIAALVAQDLTMTYPGTSRPALDGVDLVVDPGQCVALLGPNGAGKTTLIRTATGLRRPDRGTIRLAGGDPSRADVRATLGVMLQTTAFPEYLTVRELVVGAALRAGREATCADNVLEEVGMDDLAGRRSHQLSGGQRRRLQLARALVVDPVLLVLDEPTEGLDATSRAATWSNLAARRDAGMAILLTTHLVEEAGQVADRVAVIAHGRIVANEPPGSLIGRLPDRTIELATSTSLDRVGAHPGVLSATSESAVDDPGIHRVTVVTRQPETVVRWLLDNDPDAHDLRVVGASLDDAILALTDDQDNAARPAPPAGNTPGNDPERVAARTDVNSRAPAHTLH